jgi:hypothetical protein
MIISFLEAKVKRLEAKIERSNLSALSVRHWFQSNHSEIIKKARQVGAGFLLSDYPPLAHK